MRIFEDFCFPFEGFLFFRLARHACPAGDSLLSALEQARNGKTKGTGRHLRGKTALKQAGTSAPRRAIHHGQVTNSRAPTAAGAPQNDRTDEDGSDPAENDRAIRGYSRGILFRAIPGLAAMWSQKQKEVIPRRGLTSCCCLVGATGFEPATPCSQSRCATKLRHAP